jgi:hypothetical protein
MADDPRDVSGIPKDVQARLRPLLTEIARLFKAPNITIIVRGGANAPGDLVFGNDNPTLALEALRAFMVREAKQLTVGDADGGAG